jgi:hypothetical protein
VTHRTTKGANFCSKFYFAAFQTLDTRKNSQLDVSCEKAVGRKKKLLQVWVASSFREMVQLQNITTVLQFFLSREKNLTTRFELFSAKLLQNIHMCRR